MCFGDEHKFFGKRLFSYFITTYVSLDNAIAFIFNNLVIIIMIIVVNLKIIIENEKWPILLTSNQILRLLWKCANI